MSSRRVASPGLTSAAVVGTAADGAGPCVVAAASNLVT